MTKKEALLNEFIESCKEGHIKANNIRFEGNYLMCTVNSTIFGILNNVRIMVTYDEFKFKWKDEIMGRIWRIEPEYRYIPDTLCFRGSRKTMRIKNKGI